MIVVRSGSLLLRAVAGALGVLILGVGSIRLGLIGTQRLAGWPTVGLLDPDRFQGPQPAFALILWSSIQVAIWTTFLFILFVVLQAVRRGVGHDS